MVSGAAAIIVIRMLMLVLAAVAVVACVEVAVIPTILLLAGLCPFKSKTLQNTWPCAWR